MGKTSVHSPSTVGAPKAAKKTLEALNVLFGFEKDSGEIGSVADAQALFQELQQSEFEQSLNQILQSSSAQRQEVQKNFEQSLGLSEQGIEFLQEQFPEFFDVGINNSALETTANQINAQLAARGIAASPVGAVQAGLKLGVAAEGFRNNRLALLGQFVQPVLPRLPGVGGTTSPTLFAQPSFFQPPGVGNIFGAQVGASQSNINLAGDIAVANAQFEQQFKQDIGNLFSSAAGAAFSG